MAGRVDAGPSGGSAWTVAAASTWASSRRPARSLRVMSGRARSVTALVGLLTALVGGLAATPVPHHPEVRPGAAATEGVVAWVPAVQVVAGAPGEIVAVDLALDDGTAHPVRAQLTVHEVTVDPEDGPDLAGATSLLTLPVEEVTVGAGDRVLLRATATVPPEPVLVAVAADLRDAEEPTTVSALVLLGPPVAVAVTPTLEIREDTAIVTVANSSPVPTIVDLRLRSRTWFGAGTDRTVHDLAVAGDGTRTVTIELAPGAGRRTTAVVAAPRSGAPARADVVDWPGRTLPVLVAVMLLVLASAATLRIWRRHR